jgi:hypothetical protein
MPKTRNTGIAEEKPFMDQAKNISCQNKQKHLSSDHIYKFAPGAA